MNGWIGATHNFGSQAVQTFGVERVFQGTQLVQDAT